MSKLQFSDKVLEFAKLFGFQELLNYHLLFNRSIDLPYHNLAHVDLMLLDFFELLRENHGSYNRDGIRLMVEAIVFHDFNHSGGREPDAKNIEQAVRARNEYQLRLQDEDAAFGNYVDFIIRSTEYPPKVLTYEDDRFWTDSLHDLSSWTDPLHDIDRMLVYHLGSERHEVAKKQFYGLFEEMQHSKSMNWDEFIDKQIRFLLEVEWKSSFGIARAASLQDHLKILKKLPPPVPSRQGGAV